CSETNVNISFPMTVGEFIAALESVDGSAQFYAVLDSESNPCDDNVEIASYDPCSSECYLLLICAEDGITLRTYPIIVGAW
ncbi:MAG: hypothetical protein PHF24_10125, partial [Syntrophomonas sp.]|nr:hypothetical protein [Syntrophomonas sp.]